MDQGFFNSARVVWNLPRQTHDPLSISNTKEHSATALHIKKYFSFGDERGEREREQSEKVLSHFYPVKKYSKITDPPSPPSNVGEANLRLVSIRKWRKSWNLTRTQLFREVGVSMSKEHFFLTGVCCTLWIRQPETDTYDIITIGGSTHWPTCL